jgi:hypothetical protein
VNSVGININTASKHLIELMVEWEEAGRKHWTIVLKMVHSKQKTTQKVASFGQHFQQGVALLLNFNVKSFGQLSCTSRAFGL